MSIAVHSVKFSYSIPSLRGIDSACSTSRVGSVSRDAASQLALHTRV